MPQELTPIENSRPGRLIKALSDEFNATRLSAQWHFIHSAADNSYKLTGSAYEVQTLGPDENSDAPEVSILGEPVPALGDWMVETKVTTSVPFNNACCYNFAEGALFIYLNDQNSIKLNVFPDYDTRQTEFASRSGRYPQTIRPMTMRAPEPPPRLPGSASNAGTTGTRVNSTRPTPRLMARFG